MHYYKILMEYFDFIALLNFSFKARHKGGITSLSQPKTKQWRPSYWCLLCLCFIRIWPSHIWNIGTLLRESTFSYYNTSCYLFFFLPASVSLVSCDSSQWSLFKINWSCSRITNRSCRQLQTQEELQCSSERVSTLFVREPMTSQIPILALPWEGHIMICLHMPVSWLI